MEEPLAWQPYRDQRHAYPGRAMPGRNVRTLCGMHIETYLAGPGDWLWPDCHQCWQAAIGADRLPAPRREAVTHRPVPRPPVESVGGRSE
ncbi:hypothetical protein D5S17_34660 [Pseudonocardiaceae bacterium YIM PH 21723]|nr:hypothetical protein D5S17_34660 [Pseudonocardiaceae bacterium YIM PH 21723]